MAIFVTQQQMDPRQVGPNPKIVTSALGMARRPQADVTIQ